MNVNLYGPPFNIGEEIWTFDSNYTLYHGGCVGIKHINGQTVYEVSIIENNNEIIDIPENKSYNLKSSAQLAMLYVVPTPTPTPSTSVSLTPSLTPTISLTQSLTPSISTSIPNLTVSVTPTISVTKSIEASPTPTPSQSLSLTPSITPSPTPSISITSSTTPSPTPSVSLSTTPTITPTISTTISLSVTPSTTISITPSITPSRIYASLNDLSSYAPLNNANLTGTTTVSNLDTSVISVNGNAGTWRFYNVSTNGVSRWQWGSDITAETGNNVGSDFNLWSYDDTGAVLSNSIHIDRSTGAISFAGQVTINNKVPWDSGNLNPTLLAPLENPTFTGTVNIPTANDGTNTTQAASTAFVNTSISTALSPINASIGSIQAQLQAPIHYDIFQSWQGTTPLPIEDGTYILTYCCPRPVTINTGFSGSVCTFATAATAQVNFVITGNQKIIGNITVPANSNMGSFSSQMTDTVFPAGSIITISTEHGDSTLAGPTILIACSI